VFVSIQATLKDGTAVAVKKLKNPLRSFEEFRREVWIMRYDEDEGDGDPLSAI